MLREDIAKHFSGVIALGSLVVTVFLFTGINTDPVNATKFFTLGAFGIALLALIIRFGARILWFEHRLPLVAIGLFLVSILISSLNSDAPLVQNIYGNYGRNTGALTYFFFSIFFLAALLLTSISQVTKVIKSFLLAGIINIAYCAWVLAFGDFIGWENPYGNILGLFGNPNFISAFLGMYFAVSLALALDAKIAFQARVFLLFTSAVSLFEIVKSHSLQGLLVTAIGVGVVGFYFVRSRFLNMWVPKAYLGFSFFAGIFVALGTLQIGPLSFLYKRSVSLRGSYWRAGLEMGNSHPFTGVGLDTYGDWYRRSRPPVALIDTPGVNTVSNTAHNVAIDFFASGGYPLLISYLAVILLAVRSIVRFTRRSKEFDPIFVSITASFIAYTAQSIISINQIGLAVWGWVLPGLLIALDRASQARVEDGIKNNSFKGGKRQSQEIFSPALISGLGLVIGSIIAIPPLSADSKWFSAIQSRDATRVESALQPSYMNPSDSYKYAQAVHLLNSSNLNDLALKYAQQAVLFNSENFDAWKQLYVLPNSSQDEKSLALTNMKRLDPKNNDVLQ